MTLLRSMRIYIGAALIGIPLLFVLRDFVAVELVFAVLYAALVGVIASRTERPGHIPGLILLLAALALSCYYSAVVGIQFGTVLGPEVGAMLGFSMMAVAIVGCAKMIGNKFVHRRFILGGNTSGLYSAGITFSAIMATVLFQYGTGAGGRSAGGGIPGFVATPSQLGCTYIAMVSFYFLFLCMLIWRGGVMPRFMRAPRALPSLRSRRGVTLIELLIVVAMLAISSLALTHMIQVSSLQNRKSEEARLAVRIARNEFATLRATGAPRAVSIAPRESRIPTRISVGTPGPDGLVPVTVAVTIGAPLQTETVQFEALIPRAQEAGS